MSTLTDSVNKDLARVRAELSIEVEAFLALPDSKGIEVIPYNEEEIKSSLRTKYRKLTNKVQTFDFDGNKKRKKK